MNQQQFGYVVTFYRVVESGSFGGAADRLGLAASVVSKHVSKLEKALGTRLLNRSTRRFSLTETGRIVFEHARRIVEELEQTEQAVATLQSVPTGLLRVTTLPSIMGHILAPLLPRFFQAYPGVDLEIVASERSLNLAEEGIDLALRMTSQPAQTQVARKIADAEFRLCGAPAYLERFGRPRRPDELPQHTVFGYARIGDPDVLQLIVGGAVLEIPLRYKLRVNSIDSVRHMVREGVGLALLPTFAIGDDVAEGRIETLMPECLGAPSGALYAIQHPNRFGSPKVRAFVDFIATQIGTPPFWERTPIS